MTSYEASDAPADYLEGGGWETWLKGWRGGAEADGGVRELVALKSGKLRGTEQHSTP